MRALYDALLVDDLEETTRTRVSNQSFDESVVLTADDAAADSSTPVDDVSSAKQASDELLPGIDESESWSDDPVRMYLTQMGEIPLLTRQQEISLAKKIEVTRRAFRTKLLECDYVIQSAYKTLMRVYRGELPFDRTVQVSVTDRLEKEQILGRIPYNMRTLNVLLKRNRHDYHLALSKSQPKSKRKKAWQNLGRRRRRAVRLIEELGLRTGRIETMIRTVEDFSSRVDELMEKSRPIRKRDSPKRNGSLGSTRFAPFCCIVRRRRRVCAAE